MGGGPKAGRFRAIPEFGGVPPAWVPTFTVPFNWANRRGFGSARLALCRQGAASRGRASKLFFQIGPPMHCPRLRFAATWRCVGGRL